MNIPRLLAALSNRLKRYWRHLHLTAGLLVASDFVQCHLYQIYTSLTIEYKNLGINYGTYI